MAENQRKESLEGYFISSDYYIRWFREVRERKTVGEPFLPHPVISHLGNVILEIGVGEGRVVRYVSKHLRHDLYVGLDISADILYNLDAGGCYVELVQADATHLPFRDHAFTGILCIDTSWYIFDKKNLFREVLRVLKKKGSFFSNFADLSNLRVALNCALKKTLNVLMKRRLFRAFLWWISYKLVRLLKVRRYSLNPDWLKGVFVYGATPFYPVRRKDCVKMLINTGFNIKLMIAQGAKFTTLSVKQPG